MRGAFFKLSILALLGTVFVLGCGEDEEDGPSNDNCRTAVTSVTSPGVGFAMLHGSFYSDETVIIQETDGTVISQGTPDSDRSTFTLSGVPSGTHSYQIVISCDDGRDNLGSFSFTVQ